ncbi:alpha-amylase family glycosyl hydrolase [Granulicella cerasi]|uniref:Alpha-amylase family glycosyl hydrolase n=1 Tax=Granulicella cerasi TaxID=741063 RepID=A0ABW1Z7B4_9BACT
MARVPTSTYRVQFHKDFTFDDAIAIVDYLRALGISHFYASPYLQAAPGSMHGYDVVDHRRVNEEVGGEEGHERFCSALKDAGLGQVLDIVPNHMSLARQNKYWWDVLENGTNSRYASFFDVDWNSPEERLRDKVLVPILGDQYGRVLKSGDIRIVRMGASFTVMVYDQELPVAPQTLAPLLSRAADYARSDMLNFLAASFARLPQAEFWDRRLILARHRDRNVLLKLLERLCAEEDNVCQAIDRTVKEFNANADDLDAFLAAQNYRLAFWKAADQQLGYRRFFDVNTLIGLRVEREHVFDETHALIIKWLKAGVLDGVRIDHPDGLRDPKQYFERLRSYAPDAWIVGEKILEPGEWMRSEWPIEGTSGYDFLNLMLGTLIDSDGLKSWVSITAYLLAIRRRSPPSRTTRRSPWGRKRWAAMSTGSPTSSCASANRTASTATSRARSAAAWCVRWLRASRCIARMSFRTARKSSKKIASGSRARFSARRIIGKMWTRPCLTSCARF